LIAFGKQLYGFVSARAWLRVVLQAAVSLGLIVLLLGLVQRGNLLASLQMLRPGAIALAGALLFAGYLLNSLRWKLLLDNVQVYEPLARLARLYFVGMFCSLFLPTSAGGDAVRILDVSRSSGRPAATIMATLQERLVGLGASLLVGLVATLYYLPRLPAELRLWALLLQTGGALAVGLLLYPALWFGLGARIWQRLRSASALQWLTGHALTRRVGAALKPIAALPSLPPLRLLAVVGVALAAILLGIGAYYLLGQALDLPLSFLMFCMVVPMVWVVRMIPVSLNGLGLGEGAFVFLMGLFGAPADRALALALAVLALQVALALLGGLVLLLRVVRGNWARGPRPAVD
jgi:hypothetical protein